MLIDSINTLNPEQKRAVLTTEGPLLILAGAGSGKTRVLTHRIAYLIEQGVRPFNIFAITFTNKAAREMKERVCAITPQGGDVWVSTFHSSCVRILRREIDRIGYTSSFTIYDADDSERLVKNILKELNLSDTLFKPKTVLSIIGAQKDKLIGPEEYARLAEGDFKLTKYVQIYQMYQKHLKDNNALDFDDLIFKCVELFKTCPDVLEKWQERFRYIMVDEYQDTNASQYQFVRMLASKYNNLCVVGDDDQSIYGWRGADIHNILDFEKDFPGTTTIRLEQNYRSSENILNAANAVIRNNVVRKTKTLRTQASSGELLHFFRGDSDREEASFISSKIADGVKAGASYSDYAILYRNNALSRVIEENLVRAAIPYRLFGGTRFYDRKEIKDVMCYLKALYNPNDDIAIRRIINVPKRGIGDATIAKVAEVASQNEISFYSALLSVEVVPELKNKAKQLNAFTELLLDLRSTAENHSVSETIEFMLDKTGYRSELEKENTDEAKGRLENLAELISKAVEFEKSNADATMADFLEEVALVADVDGYTEGADTVVLMTLHSSKGLEFPTVFIAGFEDGIFPSFMSLDNQTGLEEERRLCYVGITRAKQSLYLTAAKQRMQHGEFRANLPSRFLDEIPKELLERERPKRAVQPISGGFGQAVGGRGYGTGTNYSSNSFVSSYTNKTSTYTMPTPKDVTLDYEVGDMVRHKKFGLGKVTSISPAGADFEVGVEFDNVGKKRLMAGFANLKKV
jgi:DNA helicase-2/ATP-dependent DNA helicase PcrA